MAKNKKNYQRYRDPRFIISVVIAVILIFVFTITLFVTPDTAPVADLDQLPTSTFAPPTPIQAPSPEPGGPVLRLEEQQLQNNGFFQASVPEGWTVINNTYDSGLVQAALEFRNAERLAEIGFFVRQGVNYPSHEALAEELLNDSFFITAWGRFTGFSETSRSVSEAVTVDFELSQGELNYIGRQIAWLDGDWLKMLRISVPSNYPALLDAIQEMSLPTFVSYADQRGGPPTLSAYADFEQGFLVRHPNWQQVSGGTGRTTILGDLSETSRLRLQTVPETTLASLDEAEAYLSETLRPGAAVLSSQVVEKEFGAGYWVSYSDQDTEGNPIAGLVALLNDAEGGLYIADMRLAASTVDLLTAETDVQAAQIRDIVASFMVLPPEDYTVTPSENPTYVEPEPVPGEVDETNEPSAASTQEADSAEEVNEEATPEAETEE